MVVQQLQQRQVAVAADRLKPPKVIAPCCSPWRARSWRRSKPKTRPGLQLWRHGWWQRAALLEPLAPGEDQQGVLPRPLHQRQASPQPAGIRLECTSPILESGWRCTRTWRRASTTSAVYASTIRGVQRVTQHLYQGVVEARGVTPSFMKASVSRLTRRPTASALSGFCLNLRPTLPVGSRTDGRRSVEGPTGVARRGSTSTTAAAAGRDEVGLLLSRHPRPSSGDKIPPSSKVSKAKPKSGVLHQPILLPLDARNAQWLQWRIAQARHHRGTPWQEAASPNKRGRLRTG